MNEQERQIYELNATVKCKLAPSKIHGIGVFAIRDIQKGERLYVRPDASQSPELRVWYKVPFGSFGKLFPEVRELILDRWPSVVNGGLFTSPNEQWPVLWMNHSDDPNYESKTDSALRDIRKGEEITEDYRTMDNWEKVFPWLKQNETGNQPTFDEYSLHRSPARDHDRVDAVPDVRSEVSAVESGAGSPAKEVPGGFPEARSADEVQRGDAAKDGDGGRSDEKGQELSAEVQSVPAPAGSMSYECICRECKSSFRSNNEQDTDGLGFCETCGHAHRALAEELNKSIGVIPREIIPQEKLASTYSVSEGIKVKTYIDRQTADILGRKI